jgi:hypothetical protein
MVVVRIYVMIVVLALNVGVDDFLVFVVVL